MTREDGALQLWGELGRLPGCSCREPVGNLGPRRTLLTTQGVLTELAGKD